MPSSADSAARSGDSPIPQSDPRKCANCGALAARSKARFCEYCGAELPVAEAPAPPPREAAPFGDVEARFAALEAHADLARWMDHQPPMGAVRSQFLFSVLGVVFMVLVGTMVTAGFFFVCPPLGFIPLALLVVVGLALAKQFKQSSDASRAPLERTPALVVDERTKVSGGGENSAARTTYFATLQLRDGSRRELTAFDQVSGKITRGDMGVAFLKGDFLVDFGRIQV